MPVEKFAWFPIVVDTWRPKGTRALIWMQRYMVETDDRPFVPLNCYTSEPGRKYCHYLGPFSYEFR